MLLTFLFFFKGNDYLILNKKICKSKWEDTETQFSITSDK